ncbi:MAG TPA: bifunctional folylpolyglutamate synthase/dihydrofolate synthase [Anaerolineae bacterium]|nr:bifunctional folylpolyglutamate synthase/dihydrofolate synthase [Anaerolineae bacterium]
MTYKEALHYIYSFTDYEKKSAYRYAPEHFDLGRVERLMALLDNPQHRFKSVHIAGTKGKGSTAAMIASILRAAGYKTGLYTSPHLHTFRERIQLDGQLISEAAVADLIERLQPLVSRVEDLTTFEIMTALAFLYFAEREADLAVLEVGMGGRLDATNIVTPLVAVITSLSYDHTQYLGDTLPLIAGEKAGIIKEGAVVVSVPQSPEAMAVIEETCREKGALLFRVGEQWAWQGGEADLEGQSFTVHLNNPPEFVLGGARQASEGARPETFASCEPRRRRYWIPLLGEHQLTNATAAIAVAELLPGLGVNIPEEAIAQGLRRVRWPGRLEVLSRAPFLVVDGAHNADSAHKLAAALRKYFQYERLILIFGASLDKDIDGMLRELLPLVHRVIVTQARHPRATDVQSLREELLARGCEPLSSHNVAEGLDCALKLAQGRNLICATGSLFVVAEVREAWARRQGVEMMERDP